MKTLPLSGLNTDSLKYVYGDTVAVLQNLARKFVTADSLYQALESKYEALKGEHHTFVDKTVCFVNDIPDRYIDKEKSSWKKLHKLILKNGYADADNVKLATTPKQ